MALLADGQGGSAVNLKSVTRVLSWAVAAKITFRPP